MRGKRAFSLALCCLLLLSGCGGDAAPAGAPPEDCAVGVLRTSGSEERSEILYFDAHLNQTGAFSLPYASVGDTFHAPVVFDGGVYFVPQGQANRRNQRLILRQDLETLDLRAYPLDQTAFHLLCDGERLYATHGNLVTGEGTALTAYDLETGERGLRPGPVARPDRPVGRRPLCDGGGPGTEIAAEN